MIFRTPDYYYDFKCIAAECRDNCCIGWEIDIDPETALYYENVGGSFGERLRSNISDGCFILDEDERCPFLNSHNLCNIYNRLGEEHLCQICTDHPRFFEWFGKIKEGGIGLCCEAAAALILSRDLVLIEREIPDEESIQTDSDAFSLYSLERSYLIDYISKGSYPEAMSDLIDYAERRQRLLDRGNFRPPRMNEPAFPASAPDPESILRFLCELEPMSPDWIPRLKRCAGLLPGCGSIPPEDFPELRRLSCYFLFRYYLRAISDADVLSRVKLTAICTWVISLLWRCRRLETGSCSSDDKMLDAKSLSKEIEYSEENLEALLRASYELEAFSTPMLKGLFL